jgi:AraC-like DNA-binding protein
MATSRSLTATIQTWLQVQTIDNTAHEATRAALAAILDDSTGIQSAKALYEVIPYSPSALKRHFPADAGIPVARTIRLTRIVRSFRRIVAYPHDPIDLVSDQLGFSTSTAMIRTWRAEAGITPGLTARALQRQRRFTTDPQGLVSAALFVDGVVERRLGRSADQRSSPASSFRPPVTDAAGAAPGAVAGGAELRRRSSV